MFKLLSKKIMFKQIRNDPQYDPIKETLYPTKIHKQKEHQWLKGVISTLFPPIINPKKTTP